MTRTLLPSRRPSETISVTWQTETGQFDFDITAGFDPATGRLAEVFYSDGMKTGTQLQASIQDTCIIVSIALQHGATVADLSKSLGEVEVMGQKMPASIVDAILAALARRYG